MSDPLTRLMPFWRADARRGGAEFEKSLAAGNILDMKDVAELLDDIGQAAFPREYEAMRTVGEMDAMRKEVPDI